MAQQTVYSQNREKDPRSLYYKPTLREQTGLGSLLPLDRPQRQVSPNMQSINDYTQRPSISSQPVVATEDNRPTESDFQQGNAPIGSPTAYPSMNPTLLDMNAMQPQISPEAVAQYNQTQQNLLDKTDALQSDLAGALAPASSPLPVTPPPKPSEVTEGVKSATPESKAAAASTVSTVFNAQKPAGGVGGATNEADHAKIQNDIAKIADSKHPAKAWQDLQQQPFYQNSSFYSGLVGVGLAIASGKSPLEAFQVGQSMSQQDDIKQQLQANRDALLDQGYSPDSIANAISKGDASLLKMQQMSDQDRMNQQNATWQYQHDLSRQEANQDYERNKADQAAAGATRFEQEKQLAQIRADNALNTYKSKEAYKADLKKQEAEAGNWTPDRSQMATERSAWTQIQSKFGNRALNFGTAERAINQGRYADDPDKANANAQIALEQAAQALIGGQRSIDQKDLDEMAGTPNVIQRVGNKFKVAAGFKPTDRFWNYLDSLVQGDKTATLGPLRDRMLDRASQLASGGGYTPAQAAILVNRAANLGFTISADEIEDWIEAGGSATDRSARGKGALSGQEGATPGWMTGQQ